jgi:surface protein
LKEIQNIENLNTSQVEDMSFMFSHCKSLSSIDLSSFDTKNVTNTSRMFGSCENLKTIYVGDNWNLDAVKSSDMFIGCYSLYGEKGSNIVDTDLKTEDIIYARIDGGKENPGYFTKVGNKPFVPKEYTVFENGTLTFYYGDKKPKNKAIYYIYCYEYIKPQITKVVFDKSFKNYKPVYCSRWFSDCVNLTEVHNLENLNTSEVEYMDMMFYYCKNLKAIYISDNWNIDAVKSSEDMFTCCYNLYGEKGTKYYLSKGDKAYARIDGGEENPGYFTKTGNKPFVPKEYSVFEDGTLTFYYGEEKPENKAIYYIGAYDIDSISSKVTKVVFDKSFANFKPIDCAGWFCNFENLTEIKNIEYLNTSQVKSMHWMFFECSSLSSLDLSNFDTRNVTDMSGMFQFCESLKTIYVGDNWNTDALKSSEDYEYMFCGCHILYGEKGTKYDSDKNDKTYARIDGGENNPGYFTKVGNKPFVPKEYIVFENGTLTFYYGDKKPENKKIYRVGETYTFRSEINKVVFDKSFANYRPTSCEHWFCNFENLTEIHNFENLNTSQVKSMFRMFEFCKSLSSLDLSSFDTKNVRDMDDMFGYCDRLKTIYVGDNWNTDAVTTSNSMFWSCYSLCGEKGTKYSYDKKDKTYAHIDGGEENPGYFSKVGN